MKKNSTQTSQQMETATINRGPVGRGPKAEVLQALRHFARAYCPIGTGNLPGVVLN